MLFILLPLTSSCPLTFSLAHKRSQIHKARSLGSLRWAHFWWRTRGEAEITVEFLREGVGEVSVRVVAIIEVIDAVRIGGGAETGGF